MRRPSKERLFPTRPPPRAVKSWTQVLLRKLEIFMARKPPAAYVDDFLAELRGLESATVATLAAALLAKKVLDTTRQVDEPFPDAYFDGAKPIDDAAKHALTAYAEALQAFQYRLEDDNTPISHAVARGVPTWVASCHALANPALHEKGKEIWTRLTMNEQRVEEALKMQVRRDPSDVERTYLAYRPAVFVSPAGR